VRLPTLLVLGRRTWLVLDDQLDAYRAALGDLLELVYVPGGHTVFWDAFEDTAGAVQAFLSKVIA
jgi:pimeloyl-ACP methyl ester carboxylesterase